MKSAEYYIDNYKVEIFHSLRGRETVFVNGLMVSESEGFLTNSHNFKIDGDTIFIQCKLGASESLGRSYQIYRNGQPMQAMNFKMPSSNGLLAFVVVLGLGLAYLGSTYLYQTFLG